MIEIDGGIGGGQILRTAIALSILTEKPVRIFNIRKTRPKPGLRPSHLKTIEVMKEISNAETKGVKLNSMEIEFYPHGTSKKNLSVNIGTAGSITLLLQGVLPVLKGKIEVIGGTDVPFSPTSDYFAHVFLQTLERFGVKTEMEILKRGFYPKGNGKVIFEVKKFELEPIKIIERGEMYNTDLYVVATEETNEIENFLKVMNANPHYEIVNADSNGKAIHAHTHFENTIIGADDLNSGFACARKLQKELNADGTVDSHLSDMLIPYLALAGGKFKANKITEHVKTNIWVTEKFINCRFEVNGKWISCFKR